MADRRCYTYKGTHIPGCWGCTIYGHSRCNCPPRDKADEIEQLTRRVERLERLLAKGKTKVQPGPKTTLPAVS